MFPVASIAHSALRTYAFQKPRYAVNVLEACKPQIYIKFLHIVTNSPISLPSSFYGAQKVADGVALAVIKRKLE
jgi:hypothetical protein